MNAKTITITVDPIGRPTIEANGFQGQGCEIATAGIEKALSSSGGVERVYKDSWNETAQTESAEVSLTTGRI